MSALDTIGELGCWELFTDAKNDLEGGILHGRGGYSRKLWGAGLAAIVWPKHRVASQGKAKGFIRTCAKTRLF